MSDTISQDDSSARTERAALPKGSGPSKRTLGMFLADLEYSGLISSEEIKQFRGERSDAFGKGADGLARALVKAGKLTGYQAAQLLRGRSGGFILGNYVILDVLGGGGMGHVFKAVHRRMKRQVALKILPKSAMKKEESVRRFAREVEAAARLSHPNIVASFDADEAKGVHFLVMEYVDGADLARTVAENGPLPADEVVSCAIQVARALSYAHQAGVIHRDVKPHNLLRDSAGVVKVLDMGLARLIDDDSVDARESGDVRTASSSTVNDSAAITQAGFFIGTADYSSPEQINSTASADARSDLYSLGCTLYFLIVGEPPFPGATINEKIAHHLSTPSRAPIEKAPGCPPALSAVCQKLMRKNAAERFASADELLRELEAIEASIRSNDRVGGPSGAGPANISSATGIGNEEAEFLKHIEQDVDVIRTPGSRGCPSDKTKVGSSVEQRRRSNSTKGGEADETSAEEVDGVAVQRGETDSARRNKPLLFGGIAGLVASVAIGAFAASYGLMISTRNQPSTDVISPTVESLSADVGPATNRSSTDERDRYAKTLNKLLETMTIDARREKIQEELTRLNPQWKGKVELESSSLLEAESFHKARLSPVGLTDLRPIAAISSIREIDATGAIDRYGSLADLRSLEGSKAVDLFLGFNPKIVDLEPLRGMRLRRLGLGMTSVSSIEPLTGMPLHMLNLDGTKTVDLSPLSGVPLIELHVANSPLESLEPLAGMKLTILDIGRTRVKNLAPLRTMPLKTLILNSTRVSDLEPLAGMNLDRLDVRGAQLKDPTPLTKLGSLKALETDLQLRRLLPTFRKISGLETINGVRRPTVANE